jgi:O-acetyl-ADP-ribose deacetylase (regulator of RNase III)
MITYMNSDLLQSEAKVLVNPVNTVGVMGKGLALEFKRQYPAMFEQYRALCAAKQFHIVNLWLYKTPEKWILNFPTKQHWREKSRLEYVESGLQKFVSIYDDEGIISISFPMLGCGLGGLDWENQVKPLMEQYLEPLSIEIYIHTYGAS